MTFETNGENKFKKDPLRGLDMNDTPKPKNWVLGMFKVVLLLMAMGMAVKMCNGDRVDPKDIPLSVLNAPRR